MTAIRSRHEGTITDEQKRIFEAVAPHVRAAVRTHRALAGRGMSILTDAMQMLSIAAFICDGDGKVATLTPAAEALLRKECGLQLKAGRLGAEQPDDAKALRDAIVSAATACFEKGSVPSCRTLIVRSRDTQSAPVVLDVLTLPSRRCALHFGVPATRVLVIVRGSHGVGAGRAAVLAAAYDFTSAETEIALLLADGKTTACIAIARGVTVGTVRAQIKTILDKVGVRKQVELIARLNQL